MAGDATIVLRNVQSTLVTDRFKLQLGIGLSTVEERAVGVDGTAVDD